MASLDKRKGSGGLTANYGLKLPSQNIPLKELDDVLDKYGAQADVAVEEAIAEVAEEILKESQRQVPYEFGKLLASGRIVNPDGRTIIGYGTTKNRTYDYAADQHENTTYNHPGLRSRATYIPPPTKRFALYLINPAKQKMQSLPGKVIQKLVGK